MNIKFKNIITILIISAFSFLFNSLVTKADEYVDHLPACVKDGSCVLICSYKNEIKNQPTRYSFIYYLSSRQWKIKYTWGNVVDSYGSKIETYGESVASAHLPLLTKNNKPYIYYQYTKEAQNAIDPKMKDFLINRLENNGICPDFGFVDTKGANMEVCFADFSTYCTEENPGGAGCKFEGTSTLIEDYFSRIKSTAQSLLNASCSALLAKEEPQKFINERINMIFENVTVLPEFALNYKKEISTKMTEKVTTCTELRKIELEKLEEELKAQLKSGTISQEQYDESMEEIAKELARNEQTKNDYISALNKFIYNETGMGGKTTCAEILGANLVKLIQVGYNIAKIGVAILVVVLSMMDFLSTTSSSDPDKKMKEAFGKAIKRLVLIIVMFILPLIISLIGLIWPSLDLSCLPK